MDTGFDKELDKELEQELEDSGWLDTEPVISSQPAAEQQNIDELFSEIVAQAEASYISSKAARLEKERGESETPPADDPEHGISVSKRQNKRIGDIADKIKNAELLQPEVIKDMFFGSRDPIPLGEPYDEGYDDEDDDEEILFTKRRPYTADVRKDKLIFETEYMLTPDQAAEGYMLFYNEFIRRRNIKLTLMIGAVIVLLLIAALMLPDSLMFYPFIFICAALIGIRWLSSLSARKEALSSAEKVVNDSYRLSFYNSRIIIKASELAGDTLYSYPPVMIRFEDIDLKVIDYDEIYVLVFRKNFVYTIPKSSFSDEMNKVFTMHLLGILGEDYCEFFPSSRYERFKARKQEKEQTEEESEESEASEKPEPTEEPTDPPDQT